MKERLIEIIKQHNEDFYGRRNGQASGFSEKLAQALIDNGVIVSKFKVGDKVVCLQKTKDKICECCNQTLFNAEYEIRKDIPYIVDIDINISKHYDGVNKPLISKAIIQYHLSNECGWECQEDFYNVPEKHIFAAQAEAEAALKEMEGK